MNVQPIFTRSCALSECHAPGEPPDGLILSEGFAYDLLLDIPAAGSPGKIRVDSTSTNPFDSLLYRTVADALEAGDVGAPMPPPTSVPPLSAEDRAIVYAWINQGAMRNCAAERRNRVSKTFALVRIR